MRRILCLIFLLATAPALAASPIDVREITTPAGLSVWFVPDRTAPVLALSFAFRGGMATDPEGKEGLANLVAALLDEGAGKRDSAAFQAALEDNSISLSFSAGRDSFTGALYSLTDRLDLAAALAADALTRPRFDADAIGRMRNAVLTSIRRSHADPNWAAQRAFNRLAFDGHPYGEPGIGDEDSVQAITRADLLDFVETRLARDTLLITAVGDIEEAALAALVDTIFAGLPAEAAPFAVADIAPQGAGETVLVAREAPQSIIIIGHRGIRRDDPDFYAASVMNYILGGGGFASRLQEELREKRGLTYGASSSLSVLDHAEMISAQVSTPNDKAGEALGLLIGEWDRFARDGASATEVENAIRYLTGSWPLRFTSSGGIASLLLGVRLDGLGIDHVNQRNDRIAAVTEADVNRIAARLLTTDDLAIVIAGQPEGIEPTRTITGIPE